jgi:xanthine dehydrogenase molybdenum-binding subunit
VVLTHENTPELKLAGKFGCLLNETVNMSGEEVAVVAAETRETAEKSLELIEVDYEVLPAVLEMEEAMEPGAPLVHPENGSNIYRNAGSGGSPRRCDAEGWLAVEVGDVSRGFAEADHIIEETYETPIQYNCTPMPRSVVCQWTGSKLTCWADTQLPLAVWGTLAGTLKMPLSDVRVIVYPVGGYGAKQPENIAVLVALIARMTNRPVKAQFTREEDIIATHRRLNYKSREKIGVKQDGSITAVSHKIISNCGVDPVDPIFGVVGTSAANTCTLLYRWQNSRFDGCAVMTNILHNGAMNGVGDPEAGFCLERIIDEAAERIGMDPVEFRLKNCTRYGDKSYNRESLLNSVDPIDWGVMGPDMDSLPECIKLVAEKARWHEKWQGWRIPVDVNGPKRRGIGIAIGMHHTMYSNYSAIVEMHMDGTANVLSSAVDMGQGCDTAMAQVVAETLGIRYEDITVIPADTAVTPVGLGNVGSCGTSSAITAAKYAADDARNKLFEIAANQLGVTPAELDARNGEIFIKTNPQKAISVTDVCRIGYQITGVGTNPPLNTIRDEKTGKIIYPFAVNATIIELEVDTDTGELEVIKATSASDCGLAINPKMVEEQIDLAITMANGWVRTENYVVDRKTGAVLSSDLLNYKLMSILDMPRMADMQELFVEKPCAWGAYGAKGFTEAAMSTGAPAIANAIYNAIGVRIRGDRFTPDRILAALGKC